MTRTVIVQHDYPFPAHDVWRVATDFTCFAEAMKGVATFEGMPDKGRLGPNQSFDVKVRLFGRMPPMDYHMELVHFDDDAMTFTSVEHGGAIKRWSHHLKVDVTAAGARLTDTIEIDAGLSTFMMTLWAKYVYRKRHKPRLRMLSQ